MDVRVRRLIRAAASPTGRPLWEAAVHVLLRQLEASGCEDTRLLHATAGECMRLCMAHGRTAEALRVHELLSLAGYTTSAAGVDELALLALQRQPHRAHQRRVLTQLLAAEGDCAESPNGGRASSSDPNPCEGAGDATRHQTLTAPIATVTSAEAFRLQLRQNTELLRATCQISEPLGLQYMLSQMRHVCEDARLATEVEVDPLVRIGRAVLRHPFVFTTPSTPAARERLLFEDTGRCPHAVTGLSETRRARLDGMEAAVAPLRPLCRDPLRFVTSLAAEWDALFLRRVAQTLVLPEEAHDVLPRSKRAKRTTRDRTNRAALSSDTPWTCAADALFGSASTARGRLEFRLTSRLHLHLVVPDAAFLLRHFQQLLQLARHREVVVPHAALLEVVHAALEDQGPRRFHARWVLLELMRASTVPAVSGTRERGDAQLAIGAHAISARKPNGGVTVLGLQDELALLEGSSERFFLAETLESTLESSEMHANVASVLVAKRLESFFLSSGPSGAPRAGAKDESSEVDDLVAGIVSSMRANAANSGTGKSAPLFKTRSRAYWARTPVVLATTNEETRRAAFMIGLSMFPPVNAA